MNVDAFLTEIEAAVRNQLALAEADGAVEEAAGHLLEALGPAVRTAVIGLAEQVAAEVGAQIDGHAVEVRIVDGDPVLRVVEDSSPTEPGVSAEEFDARLTLRLPPTLKGLVEEAAGSSGDSVNTWVVRTLSSRAGKGGKPTQRFTGEFDL